VSDRDRIGAPDPEELRELFHRKALAGDLHRRAAARALGVSDTEMAAISQLAQHGHLTPAALAGLLDITSGGMTALLHRLDEAGHVERHPHPADGRSVLVSLSADTMARASEVYAPLVAAMDAVASRYSRDDRSLVAQFLAEIVVCAEKHSAALDQATRKARTAQGAAAPAPGLWA
jgi:DNA-binding MarR family transcriptional regulator